MPGGDGTGPFGAGGRCTPQIVGAAAGRRFGRCMGLGRGMGMGLAGRGSYGVPMAALPKEDEIALLEGDATVLENQLAGIKKRIEELKK